MKVPADFLASYDAQLRTDAETPSAISVRRLGPLRLVTFSGGRGFITYADLGDADAQGIRELVRGSLDYFETDSSIVTVEWKTRAHDRAPGLHDALIEYGFVRGETESIMIGETRLLATDMTLPQGVLLRKINTDEDINRMSQMQADVFGDFQAAPMATALIDRLARGVGMELWVAEFDGEIVCSGRLEPVRSTEFAGIWGGATRIEWRGRGIYRALTAARARSALAAGKRLIHSDSTEFSRPILERSGLVKVSETTPYVYAFGDA